MSGGVFISKAPDDPAERKAWARQMGRIQYAMWIDEGAKCAACGRPYTSTDDFIAHNPYAGMGWPKIGGRSDFAEMFVDEECGPGYAEKYPQWPFGPRKASSAGQREEK